MLAFAQDLSIVVDGVALSVSMATQDDLTRAVIISLFTWRRAAADDVVPDGLSRMGWWGDSYATVTGDKIGSRLWLLAREALTQKTLNRAKEYAEEALAWLVADEVAARVVVEVARFGLSGAALSCTIYRTDGTVTALKFSDVWKVINNG